MSTGRITYLQSAQGNLSGSHVELPSLALTPFVTICIALDTQHSTLPAKSSLDV